MSKCTHDFFENATLPVVVYYVEDGDVYPVTVVEYGLAPEASVKTVVFHDKSANAYRSSVDMYYPTKEDAKLGMAEEEIVETRFDRLKDRITAAMETVADSIKSDEDAELFYREFEASLLSRWGKSC